MPTHRRSGSPGRHRLRRGHETDAAANPTRTAILAQGYERCVLPSGLRVLTSTLPHTNAVSIMLLFGAGSRHEPGELAGASHLLEHLVFKGTERRPTPREIADVVESVGGTLNAYTDREVTAYWCRLALPHYRQGLEVLIDMARNSLLRQEDIDKEKRVVFEEIRASNDSPGSRVANLEDELLWPDQPMGRDIAGSLDSVEGIGRDALLEYLNDQYVASNAVLAVAGGASHEEVVGQAESLLDGVREGEPLPLIPFEDNLTGPQLRVEYRKTEQAHLSIGLHGVSMFDDDRHALSLLSVVLGGSMGSRLFEEVREKRGLAYAISSYSRQYRDCGALSIASGAEPKRSAEALQVIMTELARARDGVTEEELVRAKELSKGRLLLRMEESRAVASSIGIQELLKGEVRTVDEMVKQVDAVTTEDVVRVARRALRPEKLAVAVVGPFRSPSRFARHLHF